LKRLTAFEKGQISAVRSVASYFVSGLMIARHDKRKGYTWSRSPFITEVSLLRAIFKRSDVSKAVRMEIGSLIRSYLSKR